MEQERQHQMRMLWSLGLGGFLVNADTRAIAPMLPAIAASLHTSAGTAALLVTAYSIPYGLFQLVYGPIAERIGKMNTIFVALCLFAFGTALCGVVHVFSWLLVLRIVTGMFAAGIVPTTLAEIGDRFNTADRSRAVATFMSFSTSGQALGIVIGGLVAEFFSYRMLFLLLGLACIPTILVIARQRTRGRRLAPGPSDSSMLRRYVALARNRRAWLIYTLVLCEGLVFYGGFTFLGVYGATDLHLSYFWVGILTATYSLGGFLGSRSIALAIRTVGTTRMPVVGSLLMTIGFLLIWLWSSVYGLTLGFIVLGVGYSFCHSTLQTFATELLPGGRATAVSAFAFSFFLGSGLGPIAAGGVLDRYGDHVLLGVVTLAMAAFCGFCFALMGRVTSLDG